MSETSCDDHTRNIGGVEVTIHSSEGLNVEWVDEQETLERQVRYAYWVGDIRKYRWVKYRWWNPIHWFLPKRTARIYL